MRNYGLDLEKQKRDLKPETDFVFGAASQDCIAQIPSDERQQYLPKGELQRTAKDDMMDCVTRSALNILETKFNWLFKNKFTVEEKTWLIDNGYVNNGQIEFSDAFIAILSGTTRNGNSLVAPLHAIHKQGLIPKKSLPLEEWMGFDDYHNSARITPEMTKLGLSFLWEIGYDIVKQAIRKEFIKKDMIHTAGYAWSEPVNGEYPAVDYQPNHSFAEFKEPSYFIFDNYIDSFDGDWIKKLSPDYSLLEGYRLYIKKKDPVEKEIAEYKSKGSNWFTQLWAKFLEYWYLIF